MKSSFDTNPDTSNGCARRARPWLGTLVEIRCSSPRTIRADSAINAAFAAVAEVHALMNIHDAQSEIRRLMAAPLGQPHLVHPWTWQVLAAARGLADISEGAFDFTLRGRWRALKLLPGYRAQIDRRISLDLSGVAKGFAVDIATAHLRSAGAISGVVNAGGDLRVFGPNYEQLHVRCPRNPGRLLAVGLLSNEAAATSANYFDTPARARLRNSRTGHTALAEGSVTVRAATCMIADGLTKVVAVRGLREAQAVLSRYGANALLLGPDGKNEISEATSHAA